MSEKNRFKSFQILGIQFNQKSLVRWKIYLDRARNYIGYINFVMIAFVFLNSFQSESIRTFLDQNKLLVYPAIIFLFLLISLLLGRLDTVFGVRKEELRNYASENPVMMELIESLNELKAKQQEILNRIEEAKSDNQN